MRLDAGRACHASQALCHAHLHRVGQSRYWICRCASLSRFKVETMIWSQDTCVHFVLRKGAAPEWPNQTFYLGRTQYNRHSCKTHPAKNSSIQVRQNISHCVENAEERSSRANSCDISGPLKQADETVCKIVDSQISYPTGIFKSRPGYDHVTEGPLA